jgi:hypothetical protein
VFSDGASIAQSSGSTGMGSNSLCVRHVLLAELACVQVEHTIQLHKLRAMTTTRWSWADGAWTLP